MKKAGRIALLFAGGIVAVMAIALLAVNLYVQSKGTQARIQQELSERLGTPLRIQRISVTPWWGLKLTGITMPQSDRSVAGEFLHADTFRLRIRLGSLFSGRLVINEISLVRPRVLWAQNAEGKWRLPAAEEAKPAAPLMATAKTAPSPDVATAVPPASSPRGEKPPPHPEKAEPAEESFIPEIRRINLANGSFHFLDVKGKPVATFDGVSFRSSLRNAAELRGNASIAKVALRSRFFLEELHSPVRYDADELEFSQISARAGGGRISGRFAMLPTSEDSPFVANVNFQDVQVDRILTDAGGPRGMLQGRIEGRLDANGKTADANALAGTGEIYLRDGQVRQYSLLVALGQLLRLDELSQLQLDQAHVKFHITPGVVAIDELLLSSSNIRLTATGTVDFTGKLRLESELAINDKVRAQLFRAVRENFQPIELVGYSALHFQVSGTVEKPKTNLMGKLIGPELKDLGGIISGLLGGKSDRPAKKKRDEAPRPSPAPTEAAGQDSPGEENAPGSDATPLPSP